MQKLLKTPKLIAFYLEAKKPVWSVATYKATVSRLKHYTGQKPQELYEALIKAEYNRYFIKQIFINISTMQGWAVEQGRSVFKEDSYKAFMNECPQLFRNVYEDKYTSLTLEEFKKEYEEASGEIKDILALLGFGGCRLGELSTYDGTSVVGKGGKRRRVYVPVPITSLPFKLSASQIRRRLNHNCHAYRKLAADTLLRNDVDLKTLQAFLGHTSITATQRYLRPLAEDKMQAKMEEIYAT